MAFDMSCLHFTGSSSLKILLLFLPAAVHCEALLKISTKATWGLHRCSRQANLRAFPGSVTSYQKCHSVLVSKTMCCIFDVQPFLLKLSPKYVYPASLHGKKANVLLLLPHFFPLPTFSLFSQHSHVNYFLALLLPPSSSFLDTNPGSCCSGVQISIS